MTNADFQKFLPVVPYPNKAAIVKPLQAELDKQTLNREEYTAGCLAVEAEAKRLFMEQLNLYNIAKQEGKALFWEQMREDHGYGHLPIDVICAIEYKAVQDGHSGEFSEINYEMYDLVPFVMRIVEACK